MSKIFLRVTASILIVALGITIWVIYKNINEKSTIEDKIEEEISYLDERITEVINSLNNISINMYNVRENNNQQQSQNNQSEQSNSSGQSRSRRIWKFGTRQFR